MNLGKETLAQALRGTVLCPGPTTGLPECRGIIISDLMSDVLVEEREQMLLVTSLATEQAVRTAHLMDAAALVVGNGKTLPPLAREAACAFSLCVIASPLPKYEIGLALGRLMNPERNCSGSQESGVSRQESE